MLGCRRRSRSRPGRKAPPTALELNTERETPGAGRAGSDAPEAGAVGGVAEDLNFAVVEDVVTVELHAPVGALAEEIGLAGVADG